MEGKTRAWIPRPKRSHLSRARENWLWIMNETETHRLAAAINSLRPDWPSPSLLTFIRRELGKRAYRDAAVALTWVAVDDATKTPARVLESGPWWGATLTASSDAERHPSSVHLGDLCPTHGRHRDACGCDPKAYAERQRRNAAQRTTEWVAKIRAELDQQAAARRDAEETTA